MSSKAEKRITRLRQQMLALGPVHPGRITKQYNVCGTAGCRCKDPEHPRKHGPYHYLSYTFQGKSKTVFVPKEHVAEMNRWSKRFVRLKELFNQLVEANIELAREEGLRR